jgi:hypothetical protein
VERARWKGQDEYEAWVEAWRAEHPLPPMSKKARWRIENAAWLEMRRLKRAAERAVTRTRDNGDTT